jgi:hypothetical protein
MNNKGARVILLNTVRASSVLVRKAVLVAAATAFGLYGSACTAICYFQGTSLPEARWSMGHISGHIS